MSGQMVPYDIFMAIANRVGKDRRGGFVYKRDDKGRDVVNRDLYKDYIESTILDFLPVVETTGKIIDDDLPQIANIYLTNKKS